MVMQIIKTIGKHKIPRFIYHMTSKSNYESMLLDGIIKTSPEPLIGRGVFTTELTNFFKRWRNNRSWDNDSLQERLIQQVSKGSDEIVILRIPTASLDSDKLIVRSQNRLFNWAFSDRGEEAIRQIPKMGNEDCPNGWLNKICEIIKGYYCKTRI